MTLDKIISINGYKASVVLQSTSLCFLSTYGREMNNLNMKMISI